MDEELPVDLTQLKPIPIRKTLLIINNFVANSTRFLNHFSTICEEKLVKVSNDLTRLEISLSILEAKLNSIPELDKVTSTSNPSLVSETTPSIPDGVHNLPPPPPPPPPQMPESFDSEPSKQDMSSSLALQPLVPIPPMNPALTEQDPALSTTPPFALPPSIPPPPPPPSDAIVQDYPSALTSQEFPSVQLPPPPPSISSNAIGSPPPLFQEPPSDSYVPPMSLPPPPPPPSFDAFLPPPPPNFSNSPLPPPPMEDTESYPGTTSNDSIPYLKLKDDPTYAKYFKMRNLGMPDGAIRQKMMMDGVSAEILEMDPEGPSPNPMGSPPSPDYNGSQSDYDSD